MRGTGERRLATIVGTVATAIAIAMAGCRPSADAGSTALVATDVATVAPAFAAVANDFAATCRETREYAGASALGVGPAARAFDSPPLVPAFPPRPGERSDRDAPLVPTDAPSASAASPGAIVAQGDPDCVVASTASGRAALENAVVLAYVGAIATLAGADVRPDPALFATLGGAVRGTDFTTSDATASDAARLLDELAAVLLGRRRDRDLAAVVREANANGAFVAIVRSLRAGFADGYYDELRDERSVVDAYYADAIAREAAALPSVEHAAATPAAVADAARTAVLRDEILEQRARWRALDASIARRAAGIAPYVAILTDAERIDVALAAARPIDAGAVARAAEPYATDLALQTAALARAEPGMP